MNDVSEAQSASGFLEIAAGRVEFVHYGPPPEAAPTLVFLHEGLGSASHWRDFPAKLAARTGCGALVFSRFGYGRSDPCRLPRPLRYMHDEGLTILPQVLAAADVRSAIVIGHSDGGSIAIAYAGGTEARLLRALITEAAHVFNEDVCVRSIARAREQFLTTDLRARLARHHGANTDCAFWGWNRAWLDPGFVNWNIEAFLPGIAVPMLAIQGEDDPYGSRAQIDAIARGVGAQVLILPDCGHAPHRDAAAKTLAAMAEFIERVLD